MIKIKNLAGLLWIVTSCVQAQTNSNLKLWYDKPAGDVWESALPVGNGRLGAMVYGNVLKETIQLNEHTVWSGSPNRNDNPDALASLPEIRQLIFDGKQKEAQQLAEKTIQSKKAHGQKFQPVGSLQLAFDGHESFSHYYRELDIERAIVTTKYDVGGITYTREVFASFPERLIVVRLTASRKKSISFTASFTTPQPQSEITTTPEKDLVITGTTQDHEGVKGMVKFRGISRIRLEGGQISSEGNSLVVKDADTATIFISIATNFNNYHDISGDEVKRASGYLSGVIKKSYASILKAHVAHYQKYFNRVRFDLGTSTGSGLPTDERLKNFRTSNDPEFVVLYYQFGRYLLISSSQPGGQPANLQGIWNDKLSPPWDSKYTININAQMNYWPAEKTNLAELHEPFLTMVKEMSETGKETARVMYGSRGWMAHHNTDIWRITGPVDPVFWGIWSMGGAWSGQHLWEHYLYSGKRSDLESAYPILKGNAEFFVDYLVEHPKYHWLVINPGSSPENAPKAHGGSSFDAGTTMDTQIVFDVFSSAIRAAETLGKDAAFADTLKKMRDRLAPMHIGKYGQLQEWLEDIDDPEDKHRHISHLYGLYPSNQISPYRTPQLFDAARNTLIQRGDVSTGWSMGWKINWWARMLDGNHAYKLIQNQLTPLGDGNMNYSSGGTYPNLFDAHPPFQIDGNFGCTSGITEMLMQSSDGAVHLLPALPSAWPSGTISGLRTRGGFEVVNLQWKDSRIVKVTIRSTIGGNLRLRVGNKVKMENGTELIPAAGENVNAFFQTEVTAKPIIVPKAIALPPGIIEPFVYDIPTQKGKLYTFIAQ